MARPFRFDKDAHENELHPDRWKQFERAVDAAVKIGPKHQARPKPRTMGKGRVRVGKSKA